MGCNNSSGQPAPDPTHSVVPGAGVPPMRRQSDSASCSPPAHDTWQTESDTDDASQQPPEGRKPRGRCITQARVANANFRQKSLSRLPRGVNDFYDTESSDFPQPPLSPNSKNTHASLTKQINALRADLREMLDKHKLDKGGASDQTAEIKKEIARLVDCRAQLQTHAW